MKLQLIQQSLKAPKDAHNDFGNYNYRSCESILEALKPLLAKHECSLTLSDEIVHIGGWNYVKSTARITDETYNREVSAFAREQETKKGMDAAQITGAASSYARKYALNGLFAIDDSKDADAMPPSDEITKREEKREQSARETASPFELIVHRGKDLTGKKVGALSVDELKHVITKIKPTTEQDKALVSACMTVLESKENEPF